MPNESAQRMGREVPKGNPLAMFPPRATGGTPMDPGGPPVSPLNGGKGLQMMPGGVLAGKPTPPPPELQQMAPENLMNEDMLDKVDGDTLLAAVVRKVASGDIDMQHLMAVVQLLQQYSNPSAMMTGGAGIGAPPPTGGP